jgi:DNA-binding transcriptional LysR family regulator
MEPFAREQKTLHRRALERQHILSGQFWGELRVFLAVAKAKSFNRAAEILGASQPTVSRQVKRLQDLMGCQLIVSTKHGVILTEKGRLLAQSVAELDEQLFALTSGIKANASEVEGVVRVSVTDALGSIFLAHSLGEVSRKYPKIQVHLKTPFHLSDLRENQTDMMIGFTPIDSQDLCFQPLGRLHFVPIASREYIREHGLPTRENIERHWFIQSEFYSAKTGLWDDWISLCERGRIRHYCDHPFAYGMLVKNGLGIGLLASYVVLDPASIPLSLDVHVSVPMFLVAIGERLQSRPTRLVFDWLSSILGSENPWFRDELKLDAAPSPYDIGFKRLFNLEEEQP